MKKLILSLLMVVGLTSLCFAQISVDAFTTPDDVTIAHLEDFRETVVDAINSADGGLVQTASITSAKLDANANPENRWNEGFNDFVYTGLTIPTSVSLASTTTSGTAYINGVRVVKDGTAKTYTASKQTYVDLASNGTYTYSEETIGATEPSVTANSIRLARVSSDATKVLSVRDDRTTTITLATGSAVSIADTDSDTEVHTERNTDEDKVRIKTGGTDRLIIDSDGFALAIGFGYVDNDGDTKIQLEETADDDIIRFDTGGTERWNMSASGERTMVTQPSFSVHPTSDQDNIATTTTVTVVFGTERFDQGGNFTANEFTAPVDGRYQLITNIAFENIDSAATTYHVEIRTSNKTYEFNIDPRQFAADIAGVFTFNNSLIADMDASDTAYVTVYQGGGTSQTDVRTGSNFSGALLN